MGNQNKPSLARKRLSTLAVTTTLAAVGVGVIGTGAANAATNSGIAHSQDTQAPSSTAAVLKSYTAGTGADNLKVAVNIHGTVIDQAHADLTKAKILINFGDGQGDHEVPFNAADGTLTSDTVNYTYGAYGTGHYTVTLKVVDGLDGDAAVVANPSLDVTLQAPVVNGPTLDATVSSKTVVAGGAVVVNLTGSKVDASTDATKATTTISWGDKTADTVITGDPAKILTTDAHLSHTYAAAGSYHLTVDLTDSNHVKATQVAYDVTVTAKGAVVVNRASGDDRYKTGLVISQHAWADNGKAATDTTHRQQAKAVVLATGTAFPDALAGVPLAKKAVGPLLLTDGSATTTNPDVLKEIQRILPTTGSTIYVLGGEKAISAGIKAELEAKGYTVTRLSGADRFGTALAIAKDGLGDPAHIILARGDEGDNHNGFADALAAGSYAANVFGGGNSAVVLSNNSTLDPATKAYVQSKLHVGAQNVAAIGGQAVSAISTIPGADGLFVGAKGRDRYETAAMVASKFPKSTTVGVATGLQFPDALTGGAYIATVGGPLLLTDPNTLSSYTSVAITGVSATTPEIDIFGGEKAVTPAVATAIATLVKVATIGKF